MSHFSVWHWIIVLIIIGVPLLLISGALRAGTARPGEIADTWKFRTVILVILAFAIPAWLITLPLFLFLAYRSYKAGDSAVGVRPTQAIQVAETSRPHPTSQTKTEQLAALHELLKSGALTQDEFDNEKRKILES